MINRLLLYINDSQTIRGGTMNTLTGSLVNNNATVAEVSGNGISTALRNLIIDFLRTLGRSSTYNLYVLALSYTVEGSLGLLGQSGLALSEGYEYQVLYLYFLRSRCFLNHFLDYFLRLLGQFVAQVVNLSVQTINLSSLASAKLWLPLEFLNL